MNDKLKSLPWGYLILIIIIGILAVMNIRRPEPTDTSDYDRRIDSMKVELFEVRDRLTVNKEMRKASSDSLRLVNAKLIKYEKQTDSIKNAIGNNPDYRVLDAHSIDSLWAGYEPL